MRRGVADRSTCVGAESRRGEVGGNCRCGAAARSTGISTEVIRVPGLAAERADGGDAARELVEVRLAHDHRAGIAQFFYLEGVAARHRSGEGDRRGRRGQVEGVVVVLDDDRNAVQWTTNAPRGPLAIHRVGIGKRVRVDRDHRVDRWASMVERVDAGEIRLHQPMRADNSGAHRGRELGN